MGNLVRKVVASDNPVLAAMIREVFDEHGAPREGTVYSDPTTDSLFELFQVPRSVLWVAETEEGIAGCCGIYPTQGLDEGCAELVKFYLAKHARGRGIGRELMQTTIDSAKTFGYKLIYLESFPEFSKAVGIYKKQGFERIDHPMGQSGHVSCTIWMVKKI